MVDFVGRTETRTTIIDADRAAMLAATLDLPKVPGGGRYLPPGWHWLYFNAFAQHSDTGADGHPRLGGFLPDLGLPRRMWAGGEMSYVKQLEFGSEAGRTTEITKISEKTGRNGRLVFLTLRHRISSQGNLHIEEHQNIVYRPDTELPTERREGVPAPEGPDWAKTFTPNHVLLFRYSALTLNSHRIHYDATYAREVEHYPDLLVQGPLTATLLQGFAAECCPDRRLFRFAFRAISPLFVTSPFHLQAKKSKNGDLELWALTPMGGLAMRAEASFA